jgi:hypothetical protein
MDPIPADMTVLEIGTDVALRYLDRLFAQLGACLKPTVRLRRDRQDGARISAPRWR